MKGRKGFTLIELMLVIAIISILAAIAIPAMKNAIDHAKDATTIGNLAILRGALAQYQVINDGRFPAFPQGQNNAEYGPWLHDVLVPEYLNEIPLATQARGAHDHPPSRRVCHTWNLTGNCDDPGLNNGDGWQYDANPADIGVYPFSGWGSVRVTCLKDNSRGRNWTTY